MSGVHTKDTSLPFASSSQSAALTAAWDSREDTTSHLHERAEALRKHQVSLTAETHDLFSQTSGIEHPSAQPLHVVESALTKLVAALQQIASLSQPLSSNNSEPTAPTGEWKTTVFTVHTTQSVLSRCFSADSTTEDEDLYASGDSWQASIARRAMEALQTALTSWNQTTLTPSLLGQLQLSVSSLASTQQEVDAPNGIHESVLHDLDALELGPSTSSVNDQSRRPVKDTGSPSAVLVPFSDFDNALAGADETLESALEDSDQSHPTDASLELDPQSDSPGDSGHTGDGDISLVPFSDFDDRLGGADDSLEAAGDDLVLEANNPS